MKPRIVCMLRKETKLTPFLPTKTANKTPKNKVVGYIQTRKGKLLLFRQRIQNIDWHCSQVTSEIFSQDK